MLIDGITAISTVAPADAEGIARALKKASDERCAVIPYGGGTMMELGAPVRRVDLVLSVEKLNGIIDYQPANLTVRAQAGMTLGALNRALAAHGQYLPLDPPFPDRATVGGILAANASGSLRVRFGSARDLLLGLRVALADGQIVHGGGDVVKNVAGYDLPKLFIGSLGTLGIIVEATFKIAPLPAKTASLVIRFDQSRRVCELALRLLRSPLLPLGIIILNPGRGAQSGLDQQFTLLVRFGGLESAVTQQLSEVQAWSSEAGAISAQVVDEDAGLWTNVRDLIFEKPTIIKIGVVPTEMGEVLAKAGTVSDSLGLECSVLANAVGIAFIALDGDNAAVAKAIVSMREALAAHGGHLVVQRAPRDLREQVDVWGPTQNGLEIMKKLKHELDPNGILNAGRFIGGI